MFHIDVKRPDYFIGLVPNSGGDFNGDGIKDLVAGKGEDILAIYPGRTGKGFDTKPWATLKAAGINYIRIKDLDADGREDMFGSFVNQDASTLHVWLQAP